MEYNKIIHGDCLTEHTNIKSGSVDLILTDLPYGTVKNINNVNHGMSGKCDWDITIEPKLIYDIANGILRKNGKMVLSSQEPYTTQLINKSIPNVPFNYRMIWLKDHFANSLIAKKAPVSYYEDILVFSKKYDLEGIHPLRIYFKKVMDFTGLNLKQINTKLGHRKAEHTFYIDSTQYGLCTEQVYKELIQIFAINKMKGFKSFKDLRIIDKKYDSTFNLWEGKKYKSNILKYKKDYDGYHPTQKPVLLLEDLIKTFSNEGDLVVDLTAGSGSTGVACIDTKRNYIIIEKEKKYYDIAKKRINAVPETLF
jgi:site-specific DNA-methyltransferase (adenine-specific)